MKKLFGLMLPLMILSGCASSDILLRPERATFVQQKDSPHNLKIYENQTISLQCLNELGKKVESQDNQQCLYYSADAQTIFGEFSTAAPDDATKAMRNRYISFLLSVSELNCSTFLGRAFANKASADTGRNVLQDILTGTSTAAANSAPHAAAGIGLLNLVVGKSVDNLNSSFYFEKTFQALAAAINSVRDDVKAEIAKSKSQSYSDYTIFDAVSDTRRYDDACSIRVGLAKLQDLAQDAKKAKDDSAIAKKSLDERTVQVVGMKKELELIGKKMDEYENLDKKINIALAKLSNKDAAGKLGSEIKDAIASRVLIGEAVTQLNKNYSELALPKTEKIDEGIPATVPAEINTKSRPKG